MSPTAIGQPLPLGEWKVDGWLLRTTQGGKVHRHPSDRKVWVASPGGEYRLLTLASLGAIARLWYLNEELLYPSRARGGPYPRGGEMVMDFLRDCMDHGLEEAARRNGLKPPRVLRIAPAADTASAAA